MKAKPNSAPETDSKVRPVATVERGNVAIEIFPTTNKVGGKVYPQFRFTYYSGAQRIRRRFASLPEAKTEAELVATKLANGENEVLKLTGLDRAAYVHGLQKLREWKADADLNVAVNDYVSAVRRLPGGASLRDAVDFFLRRSAASLQQRTVREVVNELVTAKTKAGRSAVHLKDLEGRLNRFASSMQMPIGQVTGAMIEAHLEALDVAGRTRKNHLRLITSLFKFAIRKKYLSKDALDELEAIEKPEEELTDIEIFSPDELAEILKAARPELVPWIVIAAFSGLRSAELQRLDWSEVSLTERHVEVAASKSKTASRRLAHLPDNAVEWLADYVKDEGRVTCFENMAKQLDWLVADVNNARRKRAEEAGHDPRNVRKFKWKRNGLRHSFISYRVAAVKDVAEVALECGNSPTMVFRHYRKVVTEAEATQWFSIRPATEANVVALPKARVA